MTLVLVGLVIIWVLFAVNCLIDAQPNDAFEVVLILFWPITAIIASLWLIFINPFYELTIYLRDKLYEQTSNKR